MSKYETVGGQVTRGEAYAKLLEFLREAQDQALVLAHLHNTESSDHDKASARGWLMIAEQLRRMQHVITDLARAGFQ